MGQENTATARPFWASNLIHTCMHVQQGEKLLIVTDEPLAYVRDTLLAEALTAQPGDMWSYTVPNSTRPLTCLPVRLLDLSKEMDVIITLLETVHAEESTSPTLIPDLLAL